MMKSSHTISLEQKLNKGCQTFKVNVLFQLNYMNNKLDMVKTCRLMRNSRIVCNNESKGDSSLTRKHEL